MSRPITKLLYTLLIGSLAAAAGAEPPVLPRFLLAFRPDSAGVECNGVLYGDAGASIIFDVLVTLTTSDNATESGVSGWSLSIDGRNLRFIPGSLRTQEVVSIPLFWYSPEIVDPEHVPATGPLAGAAQGEGIVDGVASFLDEFPPEGTENLLRFSMEVEIPAAGESTARLAFVDGKQTTGLPVKNRVVFRTLSNPPELTECVFTLRPGPVFRRGDSNGDGLINLHDAILHLTFVFIGGVELPCPHASDANDDGRLDLHDAIYSLSYAYLGTAPPPAPGPHACGPDPSPEGESLPHCNYPPSACPDIREP
jgi:hypothetical protein